MARIPSLNWLRVFEAAARTGSFSRAAQDLNMSAAAVSQQIKALEGHLKKALFVRGASHVTLTGEGKAYLPVVAQSLHAVEIATGNLFGDRARPVLTVQCSLMLATGWLARRLPAFRATHPEIQLTLATAVHQDEFRRMAADLTITFGLPPARSDDTDLLFGERLYPVAPPQIAETIEAPGDLAKWPLIEIASHRANWFAVLPADGPEPRFIYTDNTVTAFSLASGGAIALARAPASDGLQDHFGLVRCLPGHTREGTQSYQLVYPARSSLSKAATAFRTWLLDQAAAS